MPKVPLIKWIRFSFAALVYFLWVIWLGSYWLLPGIAIIFDVYITQKVPWGFWKKRKDGKKPSTIIEWIDALLFALIAVYLINIFLFQNYKIPTSSLEKSLLVGDHLFVSKMSYGPRVPNTPLSFPLVQNTFPGINTKSYFDWPSWDYKRLKGFSDVKRDDIVVFNFPAGDTVAFKVTNPDYHNLVRQEGLGYLSSHQELIQGIDLNNWWELNQAITKYGRSQIQKKYSTYGDIIFRPVDKRDNYVKRCIAAAGETLEIKHSQVYIDGEKVENPKGLQHLYTIVTDGKSFNQRFLDKMEISRDDYEASKYGTNYTLPLTEEKAEEMKSFPFVLQMKKIEDEVDSTGMQAWPYSKDYPWSIDNFGPLWMPKAGETVNISVKELAIYYRIITAYEGNTLEVKDDKIFINGEETSTYTFKMNYYFMLGDNRHKSADSRSWGFVPEDHIVGKPLLVWLSLNEDKTFPSNIRWERFFKWVANEQ